MAGESSNSKKEDLDPTDVAKILRQLGLTDEQTGKIAGGKNQKDMSSYKFWQTQPVPSFDEARKAVEQEGPIKEVDISKVSKTPASLSHNLEWCLLNLNNEKELGELYDLLSNHYVEDDEAQFRFNYSKNFFNWSVL